MTALRVVSRERRERCHATEASRYALRHCDLVPLCLLDQVLALPFVHATPQRFDVNAALLEHIGNLDPGRLRAASMRFGQDFVMLNGLRVSYSKGSGFVAGDDQAVHIGGQKTQPRAFLVARAAPIARILRPPVVAEEEVVDVHEGAKLITLDGSRGGLGG